MRKCPAAAEVDREAVFLAILSHPVTLKASEVELVPTAVGCELAAFHGDDHAAEVWDPCDRPTHALWVRWTPAGEQRFEMLPWCEAPKGHSVCTLYRGHAREHSQEIEDPVGDAEYRRFCAENPSFLNRLGLDPHSGE